MEQKRLKGGPGGFALQWISEYREELFGIAILSIMFFHFTVIYLDFYESGQSLLFVSVSRFNKLIGSAGVDAFVFLSGVGLYYSFSGNSDILRFYSRRYKRIIPPYVIVAGVFWLFIDVIYTDSGLIRWLEDFTFVTFFREGVNNFWFIAFIAGMYLVFPLLYKLIFGSSAGWLVFILLTAAAFLFPVWVHVHEPEIYSRLNIALTRVPWFIVGTYAGRFIKECKHIPHIVAMTVILAGPVCKYYVTTQGIKGPLNRYATGLLAISFMLLFVYVIRLLQNVKILRKVLCFFGKYSLEFYLLHVALWGIFAGAGATLYKAGSYMMMICTAMILAPLLSKMTAFITRREHSVQGSSSNDDAIK